jgi:hypothetical protein
MSISSIIPISEREEALLDELRKEGKPLKTGILIKRVFRRFPLKLTRAELGRKTRSGYPWWSGCFRLDLNRLKKKGKVKRPSDGFWEIVDDSTKSIKPKPDKFTRRALNILEEIIRGAKSGEVPVSITMGDGEFKLKLGENIKHTTLELAK